VWLGLALAVAAPGAASGPGLANEPIVQVSDDPFTNPTSQHHTEVEPDTFAFGSTWVSAYQAGRFAGEGASDIGFATSSDRGQSFVHGFLPATTIFAEPAGVYEWASDPVVAFDRSHQVWLISYMAKAADSVDMLVSRSSDAVHWGAPIPVATLGADLDKDWTVCDNSPQSPFYGSCYLEFDTPAQGFPLQVTVSTDGGLTWGPARTVGLGQGGQPLVQPNGRIVMPFAGGLGPRCDQPTTPGHWAVCAITSADRATSWSTPVVISDLFFHRTAPQIRTTPFPSAGADRDGRIYLVWKDCRFEAGCTANDLLLSTSDDGTRWSDAQRIPLDPLGSNVDHFVPGLGVDPASAGSTARLALTYYFLPNATCQTAGCELDVGFVCSTDGGQTWTPPDALGDPMQLGWLAQTSQGRMIGDYISTSVFNGGALALPAFAAASPPEQDGTFHEAIYTTRAELRDGHLPVTDHVPNSGGAPEDSP
jgi:hypothetical protein